MISSASDWSLWYVGVHDAYGGELYRRDVETEELRTIFAPADRSAIVIKRDFESRREPVCWTVWPVTRDGRWLDPITKEVDRAPALQQISRHGEVAVTFPRSELPEAAYRDCQFWYLGFHTASGEEIARTDACEDELRQIAASTTDTVTLYRAVDSAQEPVCWTVWPVTRDGQWLNPITRDATRSDSE